jgi:hypothetical protein
MIRGRKRGGDRRWAWPLALAAVPLGCNRCDSGETGSVAEPADGLPRLAVVRLGDGESVTIDGHLDEPAWAHAATTTVFVNVGTGQRDPAAPVQGNARMAWDSRFLYLGVTVVDRDVRGGFPAEAIDPHLWERDTIELMVDPDGDGDNRDYYEIQVSPQNLVFDSRFDDYNAPRGGPDGPFGHQEWASGLTSAVHVDGTLDDATDRDRGYVVELQVPWKAFDKAKRAPPEPGDQWRMNVYAMQDNGGVAWSPILGKGNFHKAERFGRVTFVAAP